VIYAGPSSPITGPHALYQALGASNLHAYVPDQYDRGGAALTN
jgi:hypothetical protein